MMYLSSGIMCAFPYSGKLPFSQVYSTVRPRKSQQKKQNNYPFYEMYAPCWNIAAFISAKNLIE